jgi:molybdopterin-guanine dinucleotide biosynthesis protein A
LLKQQLDEEKLRPTILCEQVKPRIVAGDELRVWDPEGLSFINLNTPEDFQQALRRS